MAAPSSTSQTLKILALPLNRRRSPTAALHVYFHAALPAGAKSPSSYVTKVTNWTASQWDKLGTAAPDSIKHGIWRRGEAFMDRIEFEEWGLKALDKELGPKIIPRTSPIISDDVQQAQASTSSNDKESASKESMVPLIYPKSLIQPEELRKMLVDMLKQRVPLHRSRMKWAIGLTPLTAPFALIPVLPNLPFLYLMWRAWSHWRAAKASRYLQELLENDQMPLQASKQLDKIYQEASQIPDPTPDQPLDDRILLNSAQVEKLVSAFDLNKQAPIDLNRALLQASNRLKDDTVDDHQSEKQEQVNDLKAADAKDKHA